MRYKDLYLSPLSTKPLRRQQYYRTKEDGAGQDFLRSVPLIKSYSLHANLYPRMYPGDEAEGLSDSYAGPRVELQSPEISPSVRA